jgi:Cu/Ag efflux protein CusF
MKTTAVVLIVSGGLCSAVLADGAEPQRLAQTSTQTPSTPTPPPAAAPAPANPSEKAPSEKKMVGRGAASTVKVRGTVDAVDKEKGTVTLKGPKGRTVTLNVKDPAKLDAIKVGDPVVATYTEAVAFQVRKAGTATPGATVQEARVTSKPGETPAGAVGREITVTATITAIDHKANTVTIKGPEGNTETVKAKDPKNLKLIKVGDLVDITYAQALAVSLDKPSK